MLGEPSTRDLVQAVIGWIEQVAMPQLSGRDAFHGRVAANALAMVARELEHGARDEAAERDRLRALLSDPDGGLDDLRARLSAGLRSGAYDLQTPGLADHLLVSVAARVAIEQPNYGSLKRVGAPPA